MAEGNFTTKPHLSTETNAISLNEAQRWAKRWSKEEGHYNKHHHVHAFLIPKKDILEVLVEGIDAVRAYIGVNDEGVEKLMIVGTKLDAFTGIYMDMISEGAGVSEEANSIYDFTEPCPPAGDPKSPLNF